MNKFLLKLAKESAIAFVVSGGATLLVTSNSFTTAALVAAAVAGGRAVVGVIVKDVGDEKNTPSL